MNAQELAALAAELPVGNWRYDDLCDPAAMRHVLEAAARLRAAIEAGEVVAAPVTPIPQDEILPEVHALTTAGGRTEYGYCDDGVWYRVYTKEPVPESVVLYRPIAPASDPAPWVPVAERLPLVFERVWLTYELRSGDNIARRVGVFCLTGAGEQFELSIDGGLVHPSKYFAPGVTFTPISWREIAPIPEPDPVTQPKEVTP